MSDDDYSMRSQMRSNFQDLINNQLMTESGWPRNANGQRNLTKGSYHSI